MSIVSNKFPLLLVGIINTEVLESMNLSRLNLDVHC